MTSGEHQILFTMLLTKNSSSLWIHAEPVPKESGMKKNRWHITLLQNVINSIHLKTMDWAKTGKESPAHHVQVMVYMYAVPRVLRQYSGMSFDGKVVYKDHEVSIPSSAVSQAFIENLSNLIRRLGSETPARKVPNLAECGFCDITKADCLSYYICHFDICRISTIA